MRRRSIVDELAPERTLAVTLRERLTAALDAARDSGRAYGTALARWKYAQTESRVRQALPLELSHFEDSARLSAVQRDVQRELGSELTGPVVAPSASQVGLSVR